jgi:hypothetical protein
MFQARVIAISFALATGCAGPSAPPAEYPPLEAPPPPAPEIPPSAPVAQEPPPPPPPPPVQVVASESTPIEGAKPSLKLLSPKTGQLFKGETIDLKLALEGWGLSPDGNHVHVIVDNEPYIAVRDVQKPIDLRALVQKELGHELSEGTHLLRVFPSRGHHESVKELGNFAAVVFHFKKKSPDFAFDAKAPLLTYSRPKGCVVLGQRMLVDFYLANAKLSATDARVRLTVDDALIGEITSWQPHHVENLPEGEHVVRLTLTDASGSPLAGAYNDTTRTIRIHSDCKPTTPAPPAPAAP